MSKIIPMILKKKRFLLLEGLFIYWFVSIFWFIRNVGPIRECLDIYIYARPRSYLIVRRVVVIIISSGFYRSSLYKFVSQLY